MEHLYNYSLEELTEYFKSINEKPFRAKQVFQWLYQKNAFDFQEMSNISKDLREKLEKQCIIDTFEIQEKQVSSDGTIKYLFKMIDGNLIEAVLMRHDYGQSLCVTSQVGCNMQCAFCASGLLKKQRNLTAGEMVNQVMAVAKDTGIRVSHVVVMGTGEPFDNYDEVMKFVRIINHPHGLAIGARHITISTCGLVNMIERYSNEGIQTNLAISLHAPNDEIRDQLMPVNKAFNMDALRNPNSKIINTVGAGDSMVAGFIAGYELFKNHDKAFRMGMAAGAATVNSEFLATKEEIYELLK